MGKLSNISTMTMQTVTSGKVQASFGEIADIAKGGELVTITQYGRPTLLLMRYQDGIEAIRTAAGKNAVSWLDSRAKNLPKSAQEVTQEELNLLIDEARA